jgi:hypothetical protein
MTTKSEHKDKKSPGSLSAEDRVRMVRLHEEIMARVEEMAMIAGRYTKFARDTRVKQITLGAGDLFPGSVTAELRMGGGDTVCYQDPPGVCCAGPCPCIDTLAEYRIAIEER